MVENGEVTWFAADSLRAQNPWIFVSYVQNKKLQKYPDFAWVQPLTQPTEAIENLIQVYNAYKGNSNAPKFKFGVQVPKNAKHAFHLDQSSGDNLWKESIDIELDSINKFKTFKVMQDNEPLPPGYKLIPYHLIFDVRFDGCHKYCLVAGGHRTPDIPQEVVYSGVVSVETICTAFVISALNGLEVCAADISTAFLYGRTREKVYIIAGPEFGEHADKE